MTLLAALVCVLAAAALGAVLARLVGVPAVVGQMCGGVLLGPLLVGSVFPTAYEAVFTVDNRAVIARMGTVAACVFLFVAGASHPDVARTPRRDVGLLAGANALAAVLGTTLIIALVRGLDVADLSAPQSCFLALVFTVCAVPVLLRIIEERGLNAGRAARFAVAIAVSTDVVVWCLVALLDGTTGGSALLAVGDAGIVVVVVAVWPFVRHRVRHVVGTATSATGVLLTAGSCAACGIGLSTLAGVDPLIGALLGGVVFGAGRTDRAQPWFVSAGWFRRLMNNVALPIFFASAGLAAVRHGSTGVGLVLAAAMSAVAIGVRVVAVLGLARWTALERAEVRTTLWLTCARGGTELALLHIGLDSGLLPTALYAPAVVMAIVTTLLSGVLTPSAQPDRPQDPIVSRKGNSESVPFRSME